MADSKTNAEAKKNQGMKRVARLLGRIAQVGESSGSVTGMPASRIAALVGEINQEYDENAKLAIAPQIPFFVFERLIEALGRRLEPLASEELLAALQALPHGIANTDLIRRQRRLLLSKYHEHLSRHPEDTNVRVARAALNLTDRRFEAVLEDCAVLRASTPTPEQTPRLEVVALLGLNDYEQAYESLEDMLQADENDTFALYQRGQLHVAFNYAAEALADAKRLEQSSEPAHALWCAGLYLSENRATNALRLCQQVLAHAPHEQEALFLLGEAHFCSGAWESSKRAFTTFLDSTDSRDSAENEASWRRKKYFAIRRIADADQRLGAYDKALDGYGWLLSTGEYDYWALRSYVELCERLMKGHLPHESRDKVPSELTEEAFGKSEPAGVDITEVEANMTIEQGTGRSLRIRIIDPESIVYLERLPWSSIVEDLELNELTRDNRAGFTALFEQEMPALRRLSVRAERFGYACARKLVEAPFFENLTALRLNNCGLHAPALELIAAHLPPSLTELSLSHNTDVHVLPFPHRFANLLANSSVSPGLRTLDLTGCELDGEDLEILLSCEWSSLLSLQIGGNYLRDMAVERFLQFPVISRLHELRVGHSGLEKKLLLVLLDHLPDMKLATLGLEGDWTDAELRVAIAHPHFGHLTLLDLGTSHVPEADWQKLFE